MHSTHLKALGERFLTRPSASCGGLSCRRFERKTSRRARNIPRAHKCTKHCRERPKVPHLLLKASQSVTVLNTPRGRDVSANAGRASPLLSTPLPPLAGPLLCTTSRAPRRPWPRGSPPPPEVRADSAPRASELCRCHSTENTLRIRRAVPTRRDTPGNRAEASSSA